MNQRILSLTMLVASVALISGCGSGGGSNVDGVYTGPTALAVFPDDVDPEEFITEALPEDEPYQTFSDLLNELLAIDLVEGGASDLQISSVAALDSVTRTIYYDRREYPFGSGIVAITATLWPTGWIDGTWDFRSGSRDDGSMLDGTMRYRGPLHADMPDEGRPPGFPEFARIDLTNLRVTRPMRFMGRIMEEGGDDPFFMEPRDDTCIYNGYLEARNLIVFHYPTRCDLVLRCLPSNEQTRLLGQWNWTLGRSVALNSTGTLFSTRLGGSVQFSARANGDVEVLSWCWGTSCVRPRYDSSIWSLAIGHVSWAP